MPSRDIIIENNYPEISVRNDLIIRAVKWVLRQHHRKDSFSIAVILTNHANITELNKSYLKKNQSTDVLAFNLSDRDTGLLEGEVYINLDRTSSQAHEYNVSFDQELVRLTAHGVLHLLGYRDDSDAGKAEMDRLECAAIEAVC